ncbi:RNA 3'-terminal phosphate cyclase [Planctomycetes bacterium CA13]|uniref:RNA 3'-terminal phosphate cyclase n=1 Tax=Novipirellula herctigrandis TaxID=2527986 RepID=A0A5C5Z8K9_9BACT|nr:RNA 3'-terminal phosphate cyclase [Planctomycetes bacterium CA13]
MIEIDGSEGEGGGQILRSSLALSIVTGKPVRFTNLRANRNKPGLMRQHLTAVKAATEVCDGAAEGAELNSQELTFTPGPIRAGDFHFDVGTAGSCTLVLQTVLPALLYADQSSCVVVEGGTHNPFAPPFEFLDRTFVPLVSRMGAKVELKLQQHGFYPSGGGRITATVWPKESSRPLCLLNRGKLLSRQAIAVVANLPVDIASRELSTVTKKLGWAKRCLTTIEANESPGPGNVVMLSVKYENINELFVAFGKRGISAERVAQKAIKHLNNYLRHDAPVGPYLADQLSLPIALSGGGEFRTCELTDHTQTNLATIKRFLDVETMATSQQDGTVVVTIR